MDITFTQQEKMLHDQARDFLQKEAPLDLVRAMEKDQRGYPVDLWRKMAGLGWLGIGVPEAYGGSGLGMMELAIVAEQMGRVLAPAPYIATVAMAAPLVAEAGSEEQKRRVLPAIAKGERIATAAYLEPGAPHLGWERGELSVTARPQGGAYTLDGVKQYVQYAHAADVIVTLARDTATGKAVWLLVERGTPGVEVKHLATTGSDHQCHVTFKGAKAPASAKLPEGDPWALAERAVQRGAVAMCAYMAGAAQRALELTTEYAKTRVQFGRPIATFQAVRHRCADMAVDVDGARFITYEAAWTLAQGQPCALEVSVAKAYVSDAVRDVMAHGHQVHGAIGFSEEHAMPLYSRRAKMGEALFGSANLHRERVAQLLQL